MDLSLAQWFTLHFRVDAGLCIAMSFHNLLSDPRNLELSKQAPLHGVCLSLAASNAFNRWGLFQTQCLAKEASWELGARKVAFPAMNYR